tara:strand:- start:23135 stop:24313 length:1179 start_codon:yes stop_codon:yes gene_type:complete
MTPKQTVLEQTKKIFQNKYNKNPEVISISPGRINIIGEHVDYNLGLSMPAAIDKYLCIAISKNRTEKINGYSETLNDSFSNNYSSNNDSRNWVKYVHGSIMESLNKSKYKSGFDIVINSTIPMGKGVSSSAALEVSILLSINKIFNLKMSNNDIIKRCQSVDHNHINIKSGILDQSACLLSKKDSIFIIDFYDMNIEYIKYNLKNIKWILIDSKIRRELASSKYHERVNECKQALKLLSIQNNKINNFRDLNINTAKEISILPPKLQKRVTHVVSENDRVIKMKEAIKKESIKQMGDLLIKSHESLRDNYEVSCTEIDRMINFSKSIKGWIGGRIMGGGFGGVTINLIQLGYEDSFIDKLSIFYKNFFGLNCDAEDLSFVDGAETIYINSLN